MATVGSSYLNLADLRRQQDKNDDIADIIEMQSKALDMIGDAPAYECNSGDEHLTTVRTGLPSPTFRKIYQGVQPTKSTTAQVKESTGFMEDWSEADARLVNKAKNPQKFRMNEARAHIMGIAQTLGETAIYGDTDADPEKFNGFSVRFNDKSAANGNQIVDAGGTGSDNTTIWFVTWGEDTCHFLYPEGSSLGLQRKDLGEETKEKPDGSMYRVYREQYMQDVGLSVRDWRAISCVRNIDVSNLTGDASGSSADLIDLMIDAYYKLDNPGMANGKLCIYCSRTIASTLHKQAMNAKNVNLTLEQYEGRPVTMFLGSPIRRMDTILETEAQIT